MFPLLKKIFNPIVLHRCCLFCDIICDNQKLICDNCFNTLPQYHSGCICCGFPIEIGSLKTHCGKCISDPPPFDRTFALFDYAKPIPTLIWKLKFHSDLHIAQLFAQYWIDLINQFYTQSTLPDCILPVPLHHQRLKERGFNQALEIAKPIAKHFKIPIDTRTCVRIKNTQAQSTLPAHKRKNNTTNAFGLSYSTHAKHIVILDDVMTTGNTVSEISHLLKRVGVEQIDIWCCARTK